MVTVVPLESHTLHFSYGLGFPRGMMQLARRPGWAGRRRATA